MEYELNGVNLIVHLPGELDHHSVRTLPQDIELLFGEYEIRRIIFDFSAVTFMDSSGIGAVLGRYKRMCERDGDHAIRHEPAHKKAFGDGRSREAGGHV